MDGLGHTILGVGLEVEVVDRVAHATDLSHCCGGSGCAGYRRREGALY
jgi:hypothetical protein